MNSKLTLKTPEPEIDQTFYYIEKYWSTLVESGNYLSLSLPNQFVRPGGFFKSFYYWDSYFILLGLVVQGKWGLARGILDNLIFLIEKFGFIPNYISPNKVCNSRSHPPLLTAAIFELYRYINDKEWLERAIKAAQAEYNNYWMKEPHLTHTGLNRYIDLGGSECTTVPDTAHHRGIAESGWDNTPRFGSDIRQIIPVDLNCLLYRYECDLENFLKLLGYKSEADKWGDRAEQRKTLINRYLWDEDSGFYWDYDLHNNKSVQNLPRCVSSFVPLWVNVASKNQADLLVNRLKMFETKYGLVTCEDGWPNNTQWNFPVGWAPLHWFVVYGLRCYGYKEEATKITMNWLRLLARKYSETGVLREKYNVVDPDQRLPGRYGPQRGFGWTNGVFAALLIKIIFGLEFNLMSLKPQWEPSLPEEWYNQKLQLSLPNYPWPDGFTLY